MKTADRQKILMELFDNIHFIEKNLMLVNVSKKEISITPSQGLVLDFVYRNDLTNAKKIADSLSITSSAVTQLINGLVEKRYLIRKENPQDRRFSHLSLSKKADDFFKKFHNRIGDKGSEIFSILTDDDLTQYVNINKKIIKNIINKKIK
jgi:DNA-binding MarR family transcriptional regulator